jgi:hypothetical protein
MNTRTRARLERLEGAGSPAIPLVWFRVLDVDGTTRPSTPPDGWDTAPEHLRRVVHFQLVAGND